MLLTVGNKIFVEKIFFKKNKLYFIIQRYKRETKCANTHYYFISGRSI